MGTRNTAARVHGIARVYQLRYRTRTRQTRDLIPAGFAVPVTNATCLLSTPAKELIHALGMDLRADDS